MKLFTRISVLLLLCCFASSCSGTGPPDAPPESAISVEDSVALQHELQRTQARLISQCMRDFGFEYEVPVADPPLALIEASGLPPAERVSRIGYGILAQRRLAILEQRQSAQAIPPFESEEQGREFLEALFGTGSSETDGCTRTADVELQRDFGDELALLRSAQAVDNSTAISEERAQRLSGQPEIVQLDLEWSQCMRDAGYESMSYPVDAQVLVFKELQRSPAPPSDQAVLAEEINALDANDLEDEFLDQVLQLEIAIATADLECRTALNYEQMVLEMLASED